MPKKDSPIVTLIYRSMVEDLRGAERQQLENWLAASEQRRHWYENLLQDKEWGLKLAQQSPEKLQDKEARILQRISNSVGRDFSETVHKKPVSLPVKKKLMVAASIAALLLTSLYLLLLHDKNNSPLSFIAEERIEPGKDGAILTLADGQQIVLEEKEAGKINLQDGSVAVLDAGKLSYDPNAASAPEHVSQHTITTPRGRQFQLTLEDGTRVWLNASSSIVFPTTFQDKERRVKITGEAYFEVAKDSGRTFKVNVNDVSEINVLGTHFNISAYENNPVLSTTLLEGSVAIDGLQAQQNGVVLKPGQQARIDINRNDPIKVVRLSSPESTVAWKNGLFNFEQTSLEEIMRQFERWYNIDVEYPNGLPTNISLQGEITRGVPLEDLLKAFKKFGLSYELKGRKLIIEN